jgi:hypothetical protein
VYDWPIFQQEAMLKHRHDLSHEQLLLRSASLMRVEAARPRFRCGEMVQVLIFHEDNRAGSSVRATELVPNSSAGGCPPSHAEKLATTIGWPQSDNRNRAQPSQQHVSAAAPAIVSATVRPCEKLSIRC